MPSENFQPGSFKTNKGEIIKNRNPEPELEDVGRMSLEDAQEEANKIRTLLGAKILDDSETVEFKSGSDKPTLEEYNRALKVFERLVKLAEGGTLFGRARLVLGTYIARSIKVLTAFGDLLESVVAPTEAIEIMSGKHQKQKEARKKTRAVLDNLTKRAEALYNRPK